MGRINRGLARREALREEAEERASSREARTPEGQLRVLDDRLGVGVGASKERGRLEREIEQRKASKSKKGDESKTSKKMASRGDKRKAKARRNAERERGKRE